MNIVGYNCAPPDVDVTTGGQCQNGQDAVTVDKSSKNIWFDHDAVSDGSDGNLDITHASDFITISYTKFFYSTKRSDPNDTGPMGHRVCNLIGHSDSNTSEDTGHLNVTFHHDWWADNVMERMPRVRFGKVHVFNNLYTAAGNNYAVGLGYYGNVRTENNVFQGVNVPLNVARLLELVEHPRLDRQRLHLDDRQHRGRRHAVLAVIQLLAGRDRLAGELDHEQRRPEVEPGVDPAYAN